MSIPLEFQCTFEEFREGGQTINRSVNSAVRFEWVAWVCIALVTLLTISRKDSSKDGPKLVLFVPLALMTLFVIILLFSRRRQWRKNFQQNRDMQVPQRILISDDGLNFENAMSSGVIRWTGFVRLEETNRLFCFTPLRTSRFSFPNEHSQQNLICGCSRPSRGRMLDRVVPDLRFLRRRRRRKDG